MNKAIFLDRDGVIIQERGDYNFLPQHIVYTKGIIEALEVLSKKDYLLIIISNQSGIAQGLFTQQDALFVNSSIVDFFASHGIRILDVLFCPHHPYISNCICRKPDSLLIEKAMAMYHIDPSKSYLIGDMDRDIEAASKAGITPIKIEPNDDLNNYLQFIP